MTEWSKYILKQQQTSSYNDVISWVFNPLSGDYRKRINDWWWIRESSLLKFVFFKFVFVKYVLVCDKYEFDASRPSIKGRAGPVFTVLSYVIQCWTCINLYAKHLQFAIYIYRCQRSNIHCVAPGILNSNRKLISTYSNLIICLCIFIRP